MEPLSHEATAIAYVLITLGAFALSAIILFLSARVETKMILLGLVAAAAAVGYTSFLTGAVIAGPMLTRIAVLLVLGGICYSLCAAYCTPASRIVAAPSGKEPTNAV